AGRPTANIAATRERERCSLLCGRAAQFDRASYPIPTAGGDESMNEHGARSRVVVAMLSLAVGACGAGETHSDGELEVGLRLSDEATAADAGLPTYPGSKPYKDDEDSSSAANLGLSTPLFRFKVVAMDLQTADEPERVARFYRQALSKYGSVLECSDAA